MALLVGGQPQCEQNRLNGASPVSTGCAHREPFKLWFLSRGSFDYGLQCRTKPRFGYLPPFPSSTSTTAGTSTTTTKTAAILLAGFMQVAACSLQTKCIVDLTSRSLESSAPKPQTLNARTSSILGFYLVDLRSCLT